MESPFNLPQEVLREIRDGFSTFSFNRYPDPHGKKLKGLISQYLGVDEDGIVLGNGSDEIIQMILLAFGQRADLVLYPAPTFAMYRILSRVCGVRQEAVDLLPGFELDIPRFVRLSKEKRCIIFIGYPNNPTGNCFKASDIEKIITNTHSLVVIDEAYAEFSGKTLIPLLSKCKNILILRTFSKAFGLAGIRMGYLLTNPDLVREIEKIRLPYNVNSLSQLVASWMINKREIVFDRVRKIIEEREKLFQFLQGLPDVTPFPSETNFILFRVDGRSSKDVFSCLIKQGVLIKDLGNEPLLSGCLRVTIGTCKENDLFKKALRGCLST
jgi:histidinol-phosphate aminotransferase